MGHYQHQNPSSNQPSNPLPNQAPRPSTHPEPLNLESMRLELVSQEVDGQETTSQVNSTSPATNETTQTEVPTDGHSTTTVVPPASTSSSAHLFILIFIGVLFYLGRSLPWRYLHNRVLNSRRTNQIPCSNCRFYQQRLRVKCTVHPYTALTKQSIDCCDYWPRDSDKFAHSDHGKFSQR